MYMYMYMCMYHMYSAGVCECSVSVGVMLWLGTGSQAHHLPHWSQREGGTRWEGGTWWEGVLHTHTSCCTYIVYTCTCIYMYTYTCVQNGKFNAQFKHNICILLLQQQMHNTHCMYDGYVHVRSMYTSTKWWYVKFIDGLLYNCQGLMRRAID